MSEPKKKRAATKVRTRQGQTKRVAVGKHLRVDEHGLSDHERLVADGYVARGFADGARVVAEMRGNDFPAPSDRGHASEVLRRPQVVAYLRKRRDELCMRHELTADRVYREMACLAFVNVRDLYDDVTEQALPLDRVPEATAAAIQRVEVVERKVGEDVVERGYRYVIHDKNRALDAAARLLGMFEADNAQRAHAAVSAFLANAATVTAGQIPRPLGSSTDGRDGMAGPGLEAE